MVAGKKKAAKRPVRKKVMKRRLVRRKTFPKRKIVPRKKAAKKTPPKTALTKKRILGLKAIGIVTHYFPKVQAAVVKLKAPLKLGDTVKLKGHTTDFTQTITSMQIDRVPISSAQKGQEIGLLVNSRVRRNDVVCQP
jgi:putative protease